MTPIHGTIIWSRKYSEVFSTALFIAFFFLVLVELFSIIYNSPFQLLTILAVTFFFLVTLYNSFWGIWLFVAAIPFINGFSLLNGFCDISLVFVGVYLAWLPRWLVVNKSLHSSSSTSFFANLLIAIVLLNVCLVIARIGDSLIPSRFWAEWFTNFPFVSQRDNLWQINAALILLKGLFFFRMVELELGDRRSWIIFTKALYVQAIFIAGFSLFQFVDLKRRGVDYLGLYLPFNDIHSYGSYVVFLLAVFAWYFLHDIATNRACGGEVPRRSGEEKHVLFCRVDARGLAGLADKWSLTTVMNGFLAIFFVALCLHSSSRMTWLVMLLILGFLVITVVRNKKIITCLGIFIAVAFIVGALSVPKLLQTDDSSLESRLNSPWHRLGTLFNVANYAKDHTLLIRYELWKRSFEMVKDYPFTGVGVGNFYRNNVHYKNRSMGRWDSENAHNYYLQFMAELGIPGGALFLALLFSLYSRQIALGKGSLGVMPQELSVKPFLCGLGAYLLTMLTGHPLLLASQQLLFWAVVALIAKGPSLEAGQNEMAMKDNKAFRRIGVLVLSAYVSGFIVNVCRHEPWTVPAEYGLYSAENWQGKTMRWMAGKAQYYLPATQTKLDLKVVAQPFNSQKPDGLTLTVSINDSVVDKIHFMNGGTRTLSYEVSPVNKQGVKVNLEVDRVFSPKKIGLSRDSRSLGVALR